jgi:hypothetical protein
MRLVGLALLAGCNGVLGLVDIHPTPDAQKFDGGLDTQVGPCGEFTTLASIPFGALTPYSDFSVDATETHATIMTNDGGKPVAHLLLLNAGVWILDPTSDSLPSTMTSPRIANATEVFGTIPQPNGIPPLDLVEYNYSGSWGLPVYVESGPDYDALPTGYRKLDNGLEVVVEVERRAGANNVLFLLTRLATWTIGTQNPISQAGNPGGGALTSDGLTMVYAQSPFGMTTGSRLYVSRRTDTAAEFPVGTLVQLPSTGEDVEPALAGDCSHLYFRRDTTIYVAR